MTGQVMSIHRYRSPCRLVKAGQAVTLAISGIERALFRKVRDTLSISIRPFKGCGCTFQLRVKPLCMVNLK